MADVYASYEAGLHALLARLGCDHLRHADALVYQQRMGENLAAARRYGDTESRRADRAEIIDRLNALAQEALGVAFNALCSEGRVPPGTAPPAGSVTYVNTGGGAYIDGNVTIEDGDFVGRDQKRADAAQTARCTSV